MGRVLFLFISIFSLCVTAEDFFPADSGVVSLTAETFTKKTSKDVWWVLFYSPSNSASKNVKTEFVSFAADVSGLVNVGAVDCKAYTAVCVAETGKKFPVIKTYLGGNGTIYDGAKTAKLMSERAQKDIPAINVEHQTLSEHSKWLEENKLPRALLFHDKKKDIPVLWRAMSVQFQGRMAFGVISKSDRKLTRRYGIKEFPAIVVVPYISDDIKDTMIDEEGDDEDDDGTEAIGYPGVMTPLAVRDWLSKYAIEDESADNEPLGIEELTDTSCLKAICIDAAGLCAIVVVGLDPVKVDRKKLREEIQVWVQTRDLRQDNLYNFAWLDGYKQSEFISKTFGITPQDYPQVVVLAGRKLRTANFVGAYDPAAVNTFLASIQKGKTPTLPIPGITELPPLVGETERCKGMKINTNKAIPRKVSKLGTDEQEEEEPSNEDTSTPTTVKRIRRGHRGKSNIKLTSENFEMFVIKSRQPWMILFTDDPKSEIIEQWNAAAKHFGQTVKFGVMDTTAKENKQFAEDRFSITEFPAVRVFKHGKKTDETIPTNFEGELTKEEFINKGNDLLQPGEILCPAVTAAKFENWVSGAPFIPRLLLFTDKETLPSMMKALAIEFTSEEVLVGAILNQPDLAQKYEIKKFPTFVFMQGNPNALEDNASGMQKLGFNIKMLDLPSKLDYTLLQQVGDELADMWAIQRPQIAKKIEALKEASEKSAAQASKERVKSQPKSKPAKPAKTKKKEL